MKSVLCLDLGTTWGYALLEGDEIADTGHADLPPSKLPMGERFVAFQDWLLERLPYVSAVVFEQPFGRYVNVMKIQFGQATIVEVACEHAGLEYMSLQPSAIKGFATGKGNAGKQAMLTALLDRWEEVGIPAPPHDMDENEVDAIWIAAYVREELLTGNGDTQ